MGKPDEREELLRFSLYVRGNSNSVNDLLLSGLARACDFEMVAPFLYNSRNWQLCLFQIPPRKTKSRQTNPRRVLVANRDNEPLPHDFVAASCLEWPNKVVKRQD